MNDEAVTLKLGKDEALVLFELLTDCDDQRQLDISPAAERLALVRLHGALEQTPG